MLAFCRWAQASSWRPARGAATRRKGDPRLEQCSDTSCAHRLLADARLRVPWPVLRRVRDLSACSVGVCRGRVSIVGLPSATGPSSVATADPSVRREARCSPPPAAGRAAAHGPWTLVVDALSRRRPGWLGTTTFGPALPASPAWPPRRGPRTPHGAPMAKLLPAVNPRPGEQNAPRPAVAPHEGEPFGPRSGPNGNPLYILLRGLRTPTRVAADAGQPTNRPVDGSALGVQGRQRCVRRSVIWTSTFKWSQSGPSAGSLSSCGHWQAHQ
jgi:hypothetical protein